MKIISGTFRSYKNAPIGRIEYLAVVFLMMAATIGVDVGRSVAVAQEESSGKIDTTLALPTVETLRKQIKELEELESSDPGRDVSILSEYHAALQNLELAEIWKKTAAKFEKMIQSADAETSLLQASLSAPTTEPELNYSENAKLVDLENALAVKERELEEAKQRLAAAEAEPRSRANRRLEIEKQLNSCRERTEELDRMLAALKDEEEAKPLEVAKRMKIATARELVKVEVEAHEKELAAYDATQEMLPLQQDLASRRYTKLKEEVRLLTDLVKKARLQEAERQATEARMATAFARPRLRSLATVNEELAQQRSGLIEKVDSAATNLKHIKTRLSELEKEYTRTKAKIREVGRNEAIGVFLRSQRAIIPNENPFVQDIKQQQEEIRSVQLELFNLEDRRSQLTDLSRYVQTTMSQLEKAVEPEDKEDLKFAIEELAKTQRRYVDLLIREYYNYFDIIVELETKETELVDQIDQYRSFIDEQVLWTRSAFPLWNANAWSVSSAPPWFYSSSAWMSIVQSLADDVQNYPFLWFLAVCLTVVMIYVRRLCKHGLIETGRRASSPRMASFTQTVLAAFYTLILASMPFILIWFLAWRIGNDKQYEFVSVFASALLKMPLIYFPLEFIRQSCTKSGLFEKHFLWPTDTIVDLRRKIFLLIVLTFPFVLAVMTINLHYTAKWQDYSGRIFFIVIMLIAAIFMHRIFRKGGPIWRAIISSIETVWPRRIYYAIYPLMVILPLLLTGLTAFGYYYSAWRLVHCWIETLNLLIGIFIFGSMMLRWILVVRRYLVMEHARSTTLAPENEDEGMGDEIITETAEEAFLDKKAELAAQNLQARRVVYTIVGLSAFFGLLIIWGEVAPAFRILSRVPLYNVPEQSVSVPDGDGAKSTVVKTAPAAKTETLKLAEPVTLGDVFKGILVIGLMIVAIRNISGLLEFLVLRHLSIDKGIRFAITSISRYVLVAIGIVWFFSLLGLSWGNVQWILAAMSVGLGFGLQEIFANFVSGMVILFERPIRIGDVITIGDVTGRVTKIQMRATTIKNWDHKELIVPNKEFTTGRLLNWTLTDRINRIVITVGVPYDSDPDRVRDILMQTVKEHPRTLEDPKPIILMNEFGDSALQFSVRVYISGLTGRLDTTHELHSAIQKALKEANIIIPYPQLDLHIKPDGKKPPTDSPMQLV